MAQRIIENIEGTETVTEWLERTCTTDTYNQETQQLHNIAHDAPSYYGMPYSWQQLCGYLEAYKNLQAEAHDVYHHNNVTARWFAVGDWMNRVHDTADGHITVANAVPVPEDYPFAS